MYIKKKIPLNTTTIYTNMTTKDNDFELLDDSSNNLYIHNKTGELIRTDVIKKNYTLLSFNAIDSTYIVSKCRHTNHFSKLNINYDKIDNFTIKSGINKLRTVNDIFFDITNSRYLIADNKNVYSIDLNGNFIQDEINTNDFFNNCCTCCCCECCNCDNDCIFTAVGSDGIYKYISYVKNKTTYLVKISPNGSLIDTLYIDDNIDVHSIGINNGIYLATVVNNVNTIYEISDTYSGAIEQIISDILDRLITQLDTIATTETTIASLITAETDKLKRILDISTNPQDILNANNSIKDTIANTANLEIAERTNLNVLLESIKELEKLIL